MHTTPNQPFIGPLVSAFLGPQQPMHAPHPQSRVPRSPSSRPQAVTAQRGAVGGLET